MMCGVEGCDRERGPRRGWCELHYSRWIRTGQFEPRRNSGLKTLIEEAAAAVRSARQLLMTHSD